MDSLPNKPLKISAKEIAQKYYLGFLASSLRESQHKQSLKVNILKLLKSSLLYNR
jgi:hypothetical protein